jgi:hypothetical protein
VNLIPFESASLPAYLSGTDLAALTADLLSHDEVQQLLDKLEAMHPVSATA